MPSEARDRAPQAEGPTPQTQLARLLGYLSGLNALHLVQIGDELGLLRALAQAPQGRTPAELALALNLHEPSVAVWCRTGYAYEILEVEGADRFRLGPFYDEMLGTPTSHRYVLPMIKSAVTARPDTYQRYPDYIRTGRPQGRDISFGERVEQGTGGLHHIFVQYSIERVPGLAARLQQGARVLEVGCGAAGLLRELAKLYPSGRYVGLDPDGPSIELARKAIAAEGLADRVTARHAVDGRSAFADEFDIAVIFMVLHEIPQKLRLPILQDMQRALRAGGQVVIFDPTAPSRVADARLPQYSTAVDVDWIELSLGNATMSREAQDALLTQAGFSAINRFGVRRNAFTLIYASKGDGGPAARER